MKKIMSWVIVFTLILSLFGTFVAGAPIKDDPGIQKFLSEAPRGKFFNEFINNGTFREKYRQQVYGKRLGYVPEPVDVLRTKPLRVAGGADTGGSPSSMAVPGSTGGSEGASRFDLRDTGRLPPVRDQGNCGSCWAFASYGSEESSLLPAESWDLSENNLKNTHGFDPASCEGGNYLMSTAYLTRWSGPVNESIDPYQAGSSTSPGNLIAVKHVQEVLLLPDRTGGALDNGEIKNALVNTGAVYSTMYFSSSYYNGALHTYYYPGGSPVNHAIDIVGWDDAFSANNFLPKAPGDGAFIVRNSWGSGWGEGGYFYVSYYDSHIGNGSCIFSDAEPATNYDTVYQYDPLGLTSAYGYSQSTSGWAANIFTPAQDDTIQSAGFYTLGPDSTYTVSVYTGVSSSPTSGSLASSTSGTLPYAGYHTIPISPVNVKTGQKFSVVVKLNSPGVYYPIPAEAPISGYSSKATASGGQSFISSSGSSWTDASSSGVNFCIKAFGKTPVPTTGSIKVDSAPSGASIFLDGNTTAKGVTNTTLTGISTGPHSVKLTRSGYNDWSGPVTVTAGQTSSISAVLTPVPTGSIKVNSAPSGASIFLDGNTTMKGVTNTTLTGILTGTHTVKLTRSGYNDWTGQVTVTQGKTSTISAILSPVVTTGQIHVISTPSGGSVSVDGSSKGNTPVTVTNVKAGSHQVTVRKSGYRTWTGTASVTAGKTTEINAVLRRT